MFGISTQSHYQKGLQTQKLLFQQHPPSDGAHACNFPPSGITQISQPMSHIPIGPMYKDAGSSSSDLDLRSGVPGGSGDLDLRSGVPGGSGGLDLRSGVPGGSGGLDLRSGVPGGSGGLDLRSGVPGGSGGLDLRSGVPGGSSGLDLRSGVSGAQPTPQWSHSSTRHPSLAVHHQPLTQKLPKHPFTSYDISHYGLHSSQLPTSHSVGFNSELGRSSMKPIKFSGGKLYHDFAHLTGPNSSGQGFSKGKRVESR